MRFDTAQNEFFSDKKGTGGEKSRIFLTQMFVSIHLYTNTIPYKPSNCNVSFFTKKTAGSPENARRTDGTGPEPGRGKRKKGKFPSFSREKPPLYRDGEQRPRKFFREKSPLIGGANRRKKLKYYKSNYSEQIIRFVDDRARGGKTLQKSLKAAVSRKKFHNAEPQQR